MKHPLPRSGYILLRVINMNRDRTLQAVCLILCTLEARDSLSTTKPQIDLLPIHISLFPSTDQSYVLKEQP